MPEPEKSNPAAILGGIAAVIVAITGLVAIFKPKPEPAPAAPAIVVTQPPPPLKEEKPTPLPRPHVKKPSVDDTEYLVQKYTTEGDGRQTKSLTCPPGKVIIPNSAKCMNTAGNATIVSEQIGKTTHRCQWPYQAVGIGIWVEMACHSPK